MVSPPSSLRRRDRSDDSPLDYEIAREKAAALGRLGRGLEKAVAELAAFDAGPGDVAENERRRSRAALIEAAGHALWLFLVQRDSCGLRDARAVMRDYRVPAEVQARAGAFPPRR
ncbi:MAG: DUF6665 family protein [Xanthobacteraceae bacterium]